MKVKLLTLMLMTTYGHSMNVYKDRKLTTPITIEKYKSVSLSKNLCQDNRCTSINVINNTSKSILKKVYVGPDGVNPTSPLCRLIGGTPQIYYKKNMNAISICKFKDESFILTWELFNKIQN